MIRDSTDIPQPESQLCWCAGAAVDDLLTEPLPKGQTLLHCLRDGDESHVRPLVAFGHAIDGVDADGNTAMHTAASCGQAAVLRMLIMCNADPNVANRRGQDALLCAVRSKSNTMVRACCTVAVPLRCCALCGPRATPWLSLIHISEPTRPY